MQKTRKITETLANGYSFESIRRELSNEYQDDRVSMVFQESCILVLWTKVVSALEGLSSAGFNLAGGKCKSCRRIGYPSVYLSHSPMPGFESRPGVCDNVTNCMMLHSC